MSLSQQDVLCAFSQGLGYSKCNRPYETAITKINFPMAPSPQASFANFTPDMKMKLLSVGNIGGPALSSGLQQAPIPPMRETPPNGFGVL